MTINMTSFMKSIRNIMRDDYVSPLCNKLERQIAHSIQDAADLMQSVLAEAFAQS